MGDQARRQHPGEDRGGVEQGKDAIAASVSNLLIQSLLSKTSRGDRSIATLIEKLLAELQNNPTSKELRAKIESLCEMERLLAE
jgi:hypothetical protein